MPERHRDFRDHPVLFAHRGASAHAPENTLEAFRLALRLGATGLESDVWVTSDGIAVLDHDGVMGRVRRTPISRVERSALPPHIPSAEELFALASDPTAVSLDIKDPEAVDGVLAASTAAGALSRTWLCSPHLDELSSWRRRSEAVRLVWSTRTSRFDGGAERAVARLREAEVDALNLHHSEWTGGMAALVHRFGRVAFGWDAQHDRIIRNLVRMGIDGIFGDHVDRLVDGVGSEAAQS